MAQPNQQTIIEVTRRWISSMVIGLNLCPFAQRVFQADKVRFVVTSAQDESALLKDLADELKLLVSSPITAIETTLLIHPCVLEDFLGYNDFLDAAEQLVRKLRLEGILQLASFHPNYQFAGTDPEAVENYTNRSPYPMLHLLREESITDIAGDADQLLEIPERNIQTLRTLGRQKILERLKGVKEHPGELGA
jgi:hypothetical protein